MNKIMGLDVGDATVGIAISDGLRITAQGRETLRRTKVKEDVNHIIDYILQENVTVVVVGLPKNMNNSIGPQAEKTLQFVKQLKKKIQYSDRDIQEVEFVMWDERLTSVAADKMMIQADLNRKKRREIIDKVAAVYILQGYLDSLS